MENFLRMEKWIFDSPDQAGEAFRQFIKDFYQGNKLVKGGLEIGGHEVHLGNITMPVLNVFAEQDHLVPPSASRVLGEHVGTEDYTQIAFRGGHIGIYVSAARSAKCRARSTTGSRSVRAEAHLLRAPVRARDSRRAC